MAGYETHESNERRWGLVSYLELAKSVPCGELREPGNALAHPWRGRLVDSPVGRGVLRLVSNPEAKLRAAIREDGSNVLRMVNIADVRLVEEAGR